MAYNRSRMDSTLWPARNARTRPARAIAFTLIGFLGRVAPLLASPAEGTKPPAGAVRFAYSRGEGAAGCPEADAVRGGVAARLGYEPFVDAGGPLIATTITGRGGVLEARVQMFDVAGTPTTERVLTSRHNDCGELVSALELAVSIAIDPARSARPRFDTAVALPAPSPAPITVAPVIVLEQPPRPRPMPAPPARLPDPKRPEITPIVLAARLAAVTAMGSGPAVGFGGAVGISARRRSLSLAVEGRADLPSSADLRTGDVETSLLTGSLVPCVHRSIVGGCLLMTAGAIRAAGRGLIDARQVTIPFAAIGGRVIMEVPLGGILSACAFLDLSAPLTQTVLRVSGEAVWTSPPISATLGLGMGARFP